MPHQQNNQKILTRSVPRCFLCGSTGELLYEKLKDCIYGVSGEWNIKQCPNPECELMWVDPMPIEDDISKAYYNYHTHQKVESLSVSWLRKTYRCAKEGYLALNYGYKKDVLASWKKLLGFLVYCNPILRMKFDFSVMYTRAELNGLLLDVGCGSGGFLRIMKELGWNVEGVDFDSIAVENARSKGLQVQKGTLEELKYPANYFDVITMSHLIEHVHDPWKILLECNRILKHGGRIVIVTPNSDSWSRKMFHEDWRGLEPPRHLHIFKPNSLRALVEKSGFKNYSTSTITRDAHVFMLSSWNIKHHKRNELWLTQTKGLKFLIRCFQMIVWLISIFVPNIGDEIVVIAEKN